MWPRILINDHCDDTWGIPMDTSYLSPNLKEECHGNGTAILSFQTIMVQASFSYSFFVYGFLSLYLLVYMFSYVFRNELNVIVLRSIPIVSFARSRTSLCQGPWKNQVQGQVEPKRFKLSWNCFFYPLFMFSTRRQRMSLLKICFFFSIIFSLFMTHAIKSNVCVSLCAVLFTAKRKWTPWLGIKWFSNCFVSFIFLSLDKCVFIFVLWKKKLSMLVYFLCLINI